MGILSCMRSSQMGEGQLMLLVLSTCWKMEDDNADPREYCIFFILEAFGYYLAPKANRNMEREFLNFFKNVSLEQLKNMKWCDFIVDFLIEGIIAYKNGTAKGRKCWGCLLILVDIFYDFVTPVVRDKRFPRANHITEDDLKILNVKNLVELSKKVKPLDQTVYKEDYQVGEVVSPEHTGHSNDTVANASISVTLNWVSELELKVSAAHQEEANMIKDFKEKASDENKNDLALLEDNLNAKRASITDEIKKHKESLTGLVQVHGA